jgi:hypothetical protein
VAQRAYRDPTDAANRYLSRLDTGASPAFLPADLGQLRGTVLREGRYYFPLGAQGSDSLRIATEQMPHLGGYYQEAHRHLDRAEGRLADLRRQVEQLEIRYRPQLAELSQVEGSAERRDLPERVMSLRPRDQIALARVHGTEVLTRSAKLAPEAAGRTAAAREWWLRNLAPQLDKALDRQLSQRAIKPPERWQRAAEWMENALRRGLRPAHAAQVLTRAGNSLGDTVLATSRTLSLTRAVVGSPVKTAAKVAAQALGVPSLPVRLAIAALSLARSIGQAFTR